MPRHGSDVEDVEQRRSGTPNGVRPRATPLCVAVLTALLACWAARRGAESDRASRDGAHSPESQSLASPCEIRERRVMREERPLWRRALALPADALEVTFWPLRQTLFWMERDDVPDRMRDTALHPIGVLTG